MNIFAILLLAGSSTRFAISDKCLYQLEGAPVFSYSLKTFLNIQEITHIICVYRDDVQRDEINKYISNDDFFSKFSHKIYFVQGGSERKFSVFNALTYINNTFDVGEDDIVSIHDGARPFVTQNKVEQLLNTAKQKGSAVLIHTITDTIVTEHEIQSDISTKFQSNLTYIDRNNLIGIETPQVFHFSKLFDGYISAIEKNLQVTDDSGVYPGKIFFVENSENNRKITFKEDVK